MKNVRYIVVLIFFFSFYSYARTQNNDIKSKEEIKSLFAEVMNEDIGKYPLTIKNLRQEVRKYLSEQLLKCQHPQMVKGSFAAPSNVDQLKCLEESEALRVSFDQTAKELFKKYQDFQTKSVLPESPLVENE